MRRRGNRLLGKFSFGLSQATHPAARCGLALALLAFLLQLSMMLTQAQEQPATPSAQPATAQPAKAEAARESSQAGPEHQSIAGELAKQEREATGAEPEEEYGNLKHAAAIRWIARETGLSVHGAHLLALWLNFAVIVIVVFWAATKSLPGVFRNRSASLQQALDEARHASQDASRRLGDIETRLRQLDVEIGQMQAAAEKEAQAEEARIQKAAEEDIRKVVLAAEQEIATAAKLARRELSTHTAGLAINLARQQINVDSNTDQVLVRSFASQLVSGSSPTDGKGGKDGR
ncbi:MAG: ATP synthase F0 subunit B [Terriglobales bacterium]